MVSRRFAGLFLFVLALSADLLLVGFDVDTSYRLATKPLIVVGLFLFFARNAVRRGSLRWMLPALALSWLGDVLLLFEGQNPLFFILGLSAFLLAHVCYCLFFLGLWKQERIRLHLPLAAGVGVYYAGLLLLLWPVLGTLKLPVAVYGATISLMLLLALHCGIMRRRNVGFALLLGALFFVISDSLLALNRFYAPLPFAGVLIMVTYGLAQWQLVKGALLYGAE
ncbi:hypothetical protein BUE76_20000 [Cnuella takakiae]|nr:hypothetical protein BUE76_20000 [Cnuella takakiae]